MNESLMDVSGKPTRGREKPNEWEEYRARDRERMEEDREREGGR